MDLNGYIRVDETEPFRTHVEVANKLFGKSYKGHQSATIKLDENWIIWFPKFYQNGDWENQISADKKIVTMKYVPGGQFGKDKIFPKDESGRCIIFAHKIDNHTKIKNYYFVGIYTKLEGNFSKASCRRIADTLYVNGKGGFSIRPM